MCIYTVFNKYKWLFRLTIQEFDTPSKSKAKSEKISIYHCLFEQVVDVLAPPKLKQHEMKYLVVVQEMTITPLNMLNASLGSLDLTRSWMILLSLVMT